MTHDTIYQQIIKYLEENGESWSGVLCRAIHDQSGHKEAIIERRARELEVTGRIQKVYAQVDGKGPRCVKYYLKPSIQLPESRKFVEDSRQNSLI